MSSATLLSASQVDAFRQCSLKWAYRYIERAPEESRSGALVLGSAVDVAVKTAIHSVRAGDTSIGSLQPRELLREAWDGELRSKPELRILWGEKGEDAALKTAEALVAAFVRLPDLPQRIDRIESLDLRFEIPVRNPATGSTVTGLSLQGVLDAVERVDGKLRPLDLKTAANRGGYDPEDLAVHLQGAIYVWALREINGDGASEEMAFLVGLKLKEPVWEDRTTPMPSWSQKRALLTVLAAQRAMQTNHPFPQPSFLCPSCPYFTRCRTWQDSARPVVKGDPFAA